jgi:hypothetical protein
VVAPSVALLAGGLDLSPPAPTALPDPCRHRGGETTPRRPRAASRPDQVRLAEGTRFTCTVRIEGTKAPYRVTLCDVDPARATGRFALEPAKPIIDVTRKDLQGTVGIRA